VLKAIINVDDRRQRLPLMETPSDFGVGVGVADEGETELASAIAVVTTEVIAAVVAPFAALVALLFLVPEVLLTKTSCEPSTYPIFAMTA
jgi:hypothetical protein